MATEQGNWRPRETEGSESEAEESRSVGLVRKRGTGKRSKLWIAQRVESGDGKAQPHTKSAVEAERTPGCVEDTSEGGIRIEPIRQPVGKDGMEMPITVKMPQRLFAPDRIPQRGRINSYSKPEYLLDIVEALEGTTEFQWLRQSCFGRLFDLPTRKASMSGKLIHQFLCRTLVTRKKHEMWFVFSGYPVKFSLREFALLTGLNCSPYPTPDAVRKMQTPEEGKQYYWYELIGEKEDCTVGDLVDMLKRDKKLPITERMSGSLICSN